MPRVARGRAVGPARPIEVNGKVLGGGKQPLVCTPLVGRNRAAILAELARVAAKGPDLIEWRVDFFEGIGDFDEVIDVAARIRAAAAGTPIIFTRRSGAEGGEPTSLSEERAVALYARVCESRCVDIIDYELGNAPERVRQLREVSRRHGAKMIMSYHNFERTPALDFLDETFLGAERMSADIAKVAVMPADLNDVLTLLAATLRANEKLTIPLMSMSMGALGSLTRLFGWAFGSAITFAVGESSSAPGQVPIEDLQTVSRILRKALAAGE